MEIVLCIFLGVWISLAGVVSYYWIKKEMSQYIDQKDDEDKEASK